MKQQFIVTQSRDEVNNADITELRTLNKKTYVKVWNDSPFAHQNANSIINFEVGDETNQHERGVRILKELVKMYKGKPLVEQVSDSSSVSAHYYAGFRVEGVDSLADTLKLFDQKKSILMGVHLKSEE